MVRAFFRVLGKEFKDGATEVRLEAVCDEAGEYKEFFAATPAGEMRLALLNETAAERFAVGQVVQIDMTPA